METMIIIVIVAVLIFFLLGLRSYLWEEHFKRYPKDRKKNQETRKRLIKYVKERLKYYLRLN